MSHEVKGFRLRSPVMIPRLNRMGGSCRAMPDAPVPSWDPAGPNNSRNKRADDLAALAWWTQHDNAPRMRPRLPRQVGSHQHAAHRVGHEVHRLGRRRAARLDRGCQPLHERLDRFRRRRIAETNHAIAGVFQSIAENGHRGRCTAKTVNQHDRGATRRRGGAAKPPTAPAEHDGETDAAPGRGGVSAWNADAVCHVRSSAGSGPLGRAMTRIKGCALMKVRESSLCPE